MYLLSAKIFLNTFSLVLKTKAFLSKCSVKILNVFALLNNIRFGTIDFVKLGDSTRYN